MKEKITNYFKLLRCKHYIKNILLFIPLIFSRHFTVLLLAKNIIAFFAFSFMASTIYIINDIKDVEKDRMHPTKKERPIASSKISIRSAWIIAIIMFILSNILNYFASPTYFSFLFLGLYFALNVAYSYKLKHQPIIDIFLLVTFYIIRLYYGGVVVGVEISDWLYLTVMSASFFLAFGKRRNELIKTASKTRSVLQYYNKDFLDKFMYLSLALTLVFYSLWTTEQNMKYLVISIPLLFVIFLKYSLDVEGNSDGDPTEVVMKDKTLIFLGIIYAIVMILLMW